MTMDTEEKRLCQAALDGLKSYGRTEFTTRFLKDIKLPKEGVPPPKTLQGMWNLIENWMKVQPSRCRKLWAYVDELRMWGRQRVFLYEVDPDYLPDLSSSAWVEERVGGVYGEPLFQWDAEEPFLAEAAHRIAPGTRHRILRFKLIENRHYEVLVDDRRLPLEQRSTNFFVVDLDNGHAELRVQELPTAAARDALEERQRLESLVGQYLDFERFEPIALTPVMDVMFDRPLYEITGSRLKFTEPKADPRAPTLVTFFNKLFRRPILLGLNAFWECEQEVLGKKRMHFEISGGGDYVDFGGISDPARVNEVLDRIIDFYRNPEPEKPKPKPLEKGLVHRTLKGIDDSPEAEVAVLSAGAIAAAILWKILGALGSWISEEAIESLLGGVPLDLVKITILIFWVVYYYGWGMLLEILKLVWSLRRADVWRAFLKARRRRKAQQGAP